MVAALIANLFREKSAKPFSPTDFVPGYRKPPQTADEQLAIFLALKDALAADPNEVN